MTTQMKKLEVGMRVSAFGYVNGYQGAVPLWVNGHRATVKKVSDDHVTVLFDCLPGDEKLAHVNQLRRLKPKRPRREFYVNVYPEGLEAAAHLTRASALSGKGHCEDVETILVREVKRNGK